MGDTLQTHEARSQTENELTEEELRAIVGGNGCGTEEAPDVPLPDDFADPISTKQAFMPLPE
ncbi:MAG: bacteriocin [Acidimicrobiia bacterium]|nr:bacteriocin [Acidimicrobiia bacterium]MCY4456693.1 bacteriocin [Acidimicrobiaceae bacterium]